MIGRIEFDIESGREIKLNKQSHNTKKQTKKLTLI